MLESGHYSAMRHGFGCFRSFGSSGPNRGTHGAGQRPYGLLAFGHAVQIAHDVRIADRMRFIAPSKIKSLGTNFLIQKQF